MKGQRCIVYGCQNRQHEGDFVGDICAPCYEHITTGRIGPTTSFLGDLATKKVNPMGDVDEVEYVTFGDDFANPF